MPITTRSQVLEAIKNAGDSPADVACWFVPHHDIYECENHYGTWDDKPRGCPKAIGPVGVDGLPEREYDSGYGGVEGEPVLCFSTRYVYFRYGYDGAESIEYMPRNPEAIGDDIPIIGG